MGNKAFDILFPLGGIINKKLAPNTPSVNSSASEQLESEKKKLAKTRAKIFTTEGGELGQELQTGQVKSTRDTIFGN